MVLVLATVAGLVPMAALMVALAYATRDRQRGGLRAAASPPGCARSRRWLFSSCWRGCFKGWSSAAGRFLAVAVEGWTHARLGEARAQQVEGVVFLLFLAAASQMGVLHDLARAAVVRFRGDGDSRARPRRADAAPIAGRRSGGPGPGGRWPRSRRCWPRRRWQASSGVAAASTSCSSSCSTSPSSWCGWPCARRGWPGRCARWTGRRRTRWRRREKRSPHDPIDLAGRRPSHPFHARRRGACPARRHRPRRPRSAGHGRPGETWTHRLRHLGKRHPQPRLQQSRARNLARSGPRPDRSHLDGDHAVLHQHGGGVRSGRGDRARRRRARDCRRRRGHEPRPDRT